MKLSKCTTVSTVNMSREEWLERRRHSIGGSDAAALVGLSKYSSAYSVWADKTGRLEDKPDTEAMRIGRDLEEYVAQRWVEETGKRVQRCNQMIYNSDYPFAHADIDRAVIGENAGLECKTTSTLDVKQFKGVEFPEKYYAQCVHYMAVTGAQRWYLAVLVFGKGFFTYTLERDEAEIEALMTTERSFWLHVESDTPPAADGSEATAETLSAIYHGEDTEEADLFGRDTLLDEYIQIKRQMKALDDRKTEIENIIKADMQERTRGTAGRYTVSWKPQTRSTFQVKAFSTDYPDIDLSGYYKESTFRKFEAKEMKE